MKKTFDPSEQENQPRKKEQKKGAGKSKATKNVLQHSNNNGQKGTNEI